MEKEHDFVFGIKIPISIPTEQEINSIKDTLEESFRVLIENNYMTLEETVAYIKFVTELTTLSPFALDGFLKTYRANIERLKESVYI
jgi:hypothetical protein